VSIVDGWVWNDSLMFDSRPSVGLVGGWSGAATSRDPNSHVVLVVGHGNLIKYEAVKRKRKSFYCQREGQRQRQEKTWPIFGKCCRAAQ